MAFDSKKRLGKIWDFLKDKSIPSSERLKRAIALEEQIQSTPVDIYACPNGCHLADHRCRCPRCHTMLVYQGKALVKDVVSALSKKQLEISKTINFPKRKKKAKKKAVKKAKKAAKKK